jgi:hypothetical protein
MTRCRATLEIPPHTLADRERRAIVSAMLDSLSWVGNMPQQTVQSGKNRTKPAKTFKDYGRGFYLNVTRPEIDAANVRAWLKDQGNQLLRHGGQYAPGGYIARLYW